MKKVAALSIFFLVASCFAGESSKEKTPAKVVVHDSFSSIWVQSTAPFPPEITNDSQAHALCRDAAIAIGQDHLLAHVLDMKTKSKKTVAEAEIPSIDLQQSVRGVIREARVKKTEWKDKTCTVTLSLDKKNLKTLLNKY